MSGEPGPAALPADTGARSPADSPGEQGASAGGARYQLVTAVPDLASQEYEGPVPLALRLVGQRSIALPSREVVVVPFGFEGIRIEAGRILDIANSAWVHRRGAAPFFPPFDRTGPTRHAEGLLWAVTHHDGTPSRFALGRDGSFAISESVSEIEWPHPIAGAGVGFFHCLDRVAGALLLHRAMADAHRADKSWVFLSLGGISNERLAFMYNDSVVRRIHQRECRSGVAEFRIGGVFPPQLTDEEIVGFVTDFGGELGYYFEYDGGKELALPEITALLDSLMQ